MQNLFNTDLWIKAGLYKMDESPDFEGMKKVARTLSLPEGRVVFYEHSSFSSGLEISCEIRGETHRYLCRTPNQVAMMPQRIHQERVDSYFTSYFVKPFAVLFFIAALFAVFAALDRYSIHRLGNWYQYLEQHNCIAPGSDEIVRDTARCGKLDLKYGQRLQWPMKAGIVIGIVIGSVVIFFFVVLVLGRLLLVLLRGPGIHDVRA